jgi:hypothetical protein
MSIAGSERSLKSDSVSRRTVLAGGAAAPLFPTGTRPIRIDEDPILPLWRDWVSLHARATALCHRWQEIEAYLMRKVAVSSTQVLPCEMSRSRPPDAGVERDRVFEWDAGREQGCDDPQINLRSQRSSWAAEAEALGLNDIELQEAEAWRDETVVSDAIFATQATSIVGVAIKIALIVELCATGPDECEFPWPQLRAVLAEIEQLTCWPHRP